MNLLNSVLEILQKHAGWIQYIGGDTRSINNIIDQVRGLFELLVDLSKSYEYYCACNKPKEDWDDYDYMMYPIWLRLKEFLGD